MNHQRPKSGGILSLDRESTFADITRINDQRQIIAHCAFEPDDSGGVKFKRTIAKKQLQQENPHWTEHDFETRFATLERLAGELKMVIDELEPKRIDWGGFFGLAGPAHLDASIRKLPES